jgi:hypothetical protein
VNRSGVAQTRLRGTAAACAAIAVALVPVACGDDDSEPTADFSTLADEVCLGVAEELQSVRSDVAPPNSAEQAAELIELQLPVRLDGLERLQALRPPAELVAAWDQYLAAHEGRIDALDEALAAAQDERDGDFTVAQERVERHSDQARGAAEQAGLEACAELLPPAGQDDVLGAVEKLLTSQNSERICEELLTERFAEAVFGSVEKCISERGLPTASALELLDVGGIASTSAFVDVEIVDFLGDTRQQRIELVFDDKAELWKVDYRQTLKETEEKEEGSKGAGADEETTTTEPSAESP